MYKTYRDLRAEQYKLKLTYFDARGRCEAIRLLFAAGKRDYDDVRFTGHTEWADLKPKTPFGTLPILEADGHMVSGSPAVARMVAKICDLAGDNYLDQALVDSVVDVCLELREIFIDAAGKVVSNGQQSMDDNHLIEIKNRASSLLEKLERHLDDKTFFVANKLSLADIQFYASMEVAILTLQQGDALNDYPKLQALYNRVAEVPTISDYLVSRPNTTY